MVESYSKNKFEKLVLADFIIRMHIITDLSKAAKQDFNPSGILTWNRTEKSVNLKCNLHVRNGAVRIA